VLLLLLSGCGSQERRAPWPFSNGDLTSTRAAAGADIDAGNVGKLRVRWRFRLTGKPGFSGIFASNPVVVGDTVYVQDLRSDVFALDRTKGAVRWTHRYHAPNDGPNGLAVERDRVYGATDSDAFALSASTGRELWHLHMTGVTEQRIDVAPVARDGVVYLSTIGYPRMGRGAVYALDGSTGAVRWKFDTIKDPWRYPLEAGGGGLWNPVSIDEAGRVYGGNSNPGPWGGTPKRPNGGTFPGPALYTDSLLVLEGQTGRLLWHDQVTPHDIRDYDFQASPILATRGDKKLVYGAGKAGHVIAWDRDTHRRVWEAVVGLHVNDRGPLPRRRVVICPGLLGGVETPMAYAEGRLFVPVVDLCVRGSSVGFQLLDTVDPTQGSGQLIALDADTGKRLWRRSFGSPDFGCATVSNDVVFTSTYDGWVYGLSAKDGRTLWRAKMRAGINACPAVSGDMVFLGAGVPKPGEPASVREFVAYGL
jgi:outer membrane protein assembly factor BamB